MRFQVHLTTYITRQFQLLEFLLYLDSLLVGVSVFVGIGTGIYFLPPMILTVGFIIYFDPFPFITAYSVLLSFNGIYSSLFTFELFDILLFEKALVYFLALVKFLEAILDEFNFLFLIGYFLEFTFGLILEFTP